MAAAISSHNIMKYNVISYRQGILSSYMPFSFSLCLLFYWGNVHNLRLWGGLEIFEGTIFMTIRVRTKGTRICWCGQRVDHEKYLFGEETRILCIILNEKTLKGLENVFL